VLILITIRSNDQFNTTVYGYEDRLRGISGTREVVLMNEADMQGLGIADGDIIDLVGDAGDGVERAVCGFRATRYDIPRGNCAGYYPECNPLLPLWHHALRSHVPAAKSIPVRIRKHVVATQRSTPDRNDTCSPDRMFASPHLGPSVDPAQPGATGIVSRTDAVARSDGAHAKGLEVLAGETGQDDSGNPNLTLGVTILK
jgi:hypothetical protein